jgi:hypothetical protein
MASRLVEKVFLYYREGAKHDKVYDIELREEDGGFRVVGYNGRRGAPRLTPQSKTPVPVSYHSARHIFDELLYAKLNHRKTPYQIAKRETGEATGAGNATNSTTSPAKVEPRAERQGERELTSGTDGAYVANHLDAFEF